MTIEAIGYDRVSTEDQAKRGVMLAARAESIPIYCQQNGLALLDYFTDAISGWAGKKRPGFDRAMEAACQPGRVLVVDSLARFVRSNIDADVALKRLHEAGADIVIIKLGIDTRTASGKLIYRIMSAAAEFESDQISERTSAAHAYLRKKYGVNVIGPPPYGYMRQKGTRIIQQEPNEQIVLHKARYYRRQPGPDKPPMSYARVAAKLNDLGLTTRKGGTWSEGSVFRILNGQAKQVARYAKKAPVGDAPQGADG